MRYAVAIGLFDGVHRGHAGLLTSAAEAAVKYGSTSLALTFENLDLAKKVKLINTLDDRLYLIKKLYGINETAVLPFNDNLKRMTPEEFFNEYLLKKYRASYISVGSDFTFGYKGRGDSSFLSSLCSEHGIICDIMPTINEGGLRISSSRIRDLLSEGRLPEAEKLMGHPHIIRGTVESGQHIGTQIGFPTINLHYPDNLISLPFGVYITRTILSDGTCIPSVSNLGVRPTFGDEGSVKFETHLLGQTLNLYNTAVTIELLKFLRPEIKFSCTADLVAAIDRDISAVLEYFKSR